MCQGMFLGKNYNERKKRMKPYTKTKIDKKYKFFQQKIFHCDLKKADRESSSDENF